MLDKALALDPKCGEAYYSYAQYYASKENWTKAGESANKAIDCGIKLAPGFRKLLEKNGVKVKVEPTSPTPVPPHHLAAFIRIAAA